MADNNIRVEIQGDSSKLVQELDRAVKAQQQFADKFKTSIGDLTKSLDTLTNKTKTTVDSMASLATAVVGVGFTAFITNALSAASATERLAEATGVTTAKYLEMQAAFIASGKDADALGRTMLRMEATAQQANDGNERLKNGYRQLGLSMDDLHKLTPDQVFQRMARALGDLNDSGKRAELTMMLLGRDAKTLDFKRIADEMDANNGKFRESAEATRAASEAYRSMQEGLNSLKNNVLQLIEPISRLIGDNASGLLGSKTAAEALVAALAIIAGASAIGGIIKLVDVIKGLVGWFTALTGVGSAATAATGAYTAASAGAAAASIIQAAGLGRVATATMNVNLAQTELNVLMAAGEATAAELAAAEAALATATARLATVTEAAALTQRQLAASIGATATAAGGFMMTISAWASGLMAIITRVGLVVAGIEAINFAVKKAFNVDPIGYFADGLEKLVHDNFPAVYNWLEKIGAAMGMDKGKLANTGQMPLPPGVTPSTAGAGRGSVNPPLAALLNTPELHPELIRAQQLRGEIEQMNLANAAMRNRIALETELASASNEYRSQRLAEFDEETRYQSEIAKLLNRRKVLQLEYSQQPDHHEHGLEIAQIDQQLQLLKQQHGVMGDLVKSRQQAVNLAQMEQGYADMQLKSRAEIASIETEIANLGMGADAKRLDAVDREIQKNIKLMEIKRQQQLGPNQTIGDNERASIEQRVREAFSQQVEEVKRLNAALHEQEAILFAIDLQNKANENMIGIQHEMAQLTMTTDQRRIDDLKKQNELLIEQEIVKRRMALGYDSNGNLKELDSGEIERIRAQVTRANQSILTSTQDVIDKSREFSTGWTSSFNQYKSDAMNAALEAKTYFDTFTKGFEDAFVNMVQTGKLSFKDLANSIIAEFVRIQAKKLAMGLLDGIGGGGGSIFGSILGGIGSIFGFAGGGNPPVGQPSLVGENGPELFVPKTAGTIIPNNQLSSYNQPSKTEVTYNINAVDAASFQQLLAQDPQFLYAVSEKGRRSLPQGAMR